ncbi:uncharacterized protein K452DRAFT_35021 [Aplosporella prunicola CBS 121167]|uniref:Uncharacterized protein n=1 Tax=Aplosporella prunicola CBS 121167 TaxID=1176127 RepID=A0A6A6BCT9_9PEZI|nr:uncharacterized protein K452DRAFT_35021 [Aplosporella prunicola CBS 121167]KAF2141886.1 hypothetical protein K452DRAFT_35021 [Aplosporella prunicola CBS 121167]
MMLVADGSLARSSVGKRERAAERELSKNRSLRKFTRGCPSEEDLHDDRLINTLALSPLQAVRNDQGNSRVRPGVRRMWYGSWKVTHARPHAWTSSFDGRRHLRRQNGSVATPLSTAH